jgi:DnaJ-class molecular chaperone
VSVEDFDVGDGGIGSIFEQLFGRGGGGAGAGGGRRGRGAPQQAARGADVEHKVVLPFEQAVRGTNVPLQINRDGKLETIDVKIPPGVKDGSRVRIKGKGQHGAGEPGDLFIITEVQPHPYFRREGLDLLVDVPISVYEAMLGVKVEAPTLEGHVTLTIPPGTSSGAKLRIKGKGVHRGDELGDQYVVIRVIVPKHLDEADKELIHKLAEKHPVAARADVPWR